VKTNYDELIPKGVIFNLKEIEEMNIIKIDMAKRIFATKICADAKYFRILNILDYFWSFTV